MLIDTHCHVHYSAFDQDMDEVIRRNLEQGIQMITVGTQKETSKQGLDLADRYEGVWAVVGLHPNHLEEQTFVEDDTTLEVFDKEVYRQLALHPKCVGIGETGLDYYRIAEHLDRDLVVQKQKETFRAHAELATEVNLPIVVHCRDAYDEQANLIQTLIEEGMLQKRGVIHCFTGTYEQAKRFVELGFYISFSGVVTFPQRKNDPLIDGLTVLQYCARELPLDKILVETDSPYLTPIPHRGERNEPGYVKFIAEKIATLRAVSLEEIEQATTENAIKVFQLK